MLSFLQAKKWLGMCLASFFCSVQEREREREWQKLVCLDSAGREGIVEGNGSGGAFALSDVMNQKLFNFKTDHAPLFFFLPSFLLHSEFLIAPVLCFVSFFGCFFSQLFDEENL